MLGQNTFRNSLYVAAVATILTLTGIFGTLEEREVIDNLLFLSTVILILMVGGAAFLAGRPMIERGRPAVLLNALIGGAVVTVVLTILVLIDITINMRFVFQNLSTLNPSTLTAGQEISLEAGTIGGLIQMILFSLGVSLATGLILLLPARVREVLLVTAGLTVVVGLVSGQIDSIITLPDALLLLTVFGGAYAAAHYLSRRLPLLGFSIGVIAGLLIVLLGAVGALDEGGFLRGSGSDPRVLLLATQGLANIIGFVVIMGIVGLAGVMSPRTSKPIHDGVVFFIVGLLVLGVLDWQGAMTLLATILMAGILASALWFVPLLGYQAEETFEKNYSVPQRRNIQWAFFAGMMAILLIAPQFMGLYISNVFNQIALFAIMGIGLNVMIGYTGLLDLGYVASFAIGAYTLGILTTPNPLTCGGIDPSTIPFDELAETCTNTLTFWQAWPLCVVVSALTGALLGVPVLRLRGDYLAIVTLGFGEIVNRIIISNDFDTYLGGAQGISPIPTPTLNLSAINPDWVFEISGSTSVYYLFLFSVALTAFVVFRLANSRTGRAWRAVRADEDVAQAMGIHLVNTKLLAFGVSSAFAGLGGAVFGASLQGIFPNSFTLLVSINVLSLIIIGGMGSIPGVIVGALILIGLPELLRELEAYRLLAFGSLLVVVMIVKPDGLLPPKPPELSERASRIQAEEGDTELKQEASYG